MPETALEYKNLQDSLPGDGVYHYPGYPTNYSDEAASVIENKLKTGPRITMMIYKEGTTELFDPMLYVWGFLINMATVLLLYFILSGFSVYTFKTMMLACLFIGLTIALVSDISLANWYMFPWDYTLANIVDRIVPFLFLGLLFGGYTFKRIENG